MFFFTSLVSLASVLYYGWLGFRVAQARVACKIEAPAVTGDPVFERHYRVQMNTLEALPIYLVGLWLFAFYVNDAGAAVLGLVWIVGRVIYARAYVAAPKTRSTGFMIQAAATLLLCLGALGDILMRIALGD